MQDENIKEKYPKISEGKDPTQESKKILEKYPRTAALCEQYIKRDEIPLCQRCILCTNWLYFEESVISIGLIMLHAACVFDYEKN